MHHIKEIILHPGFENVSMKNDLALVRLQVSHLFISKKRPQNAYLTINKEYKALTMISLLKIPDVV